MTGQRDLARERLVRVAVAENPATAQLICDALTEAGIRSMLRNRDNASAYLGSLAAPFALEVYVLEGDADAASALLGDSTVPVPLPPAQGGRRTKRRLRRR
jgi:hypothetical protein